MRKTHALASTNKLKPIIPALLIVTFFAGITVVGSSAENKNTKPEKYLKLLWIDIPVKP